MGYEKRGLYYLNQDVVQSAYHCYGIVELLPFCFQSKIYDTNFSPVNALSNE